MRINGMDGTTAQGGQLNASQAADSVSKSIMKQIADARQQLQQLSSNTDLGVEEKMKKRQEIQQQINDLTNQLRQHEIEMRKEKQQAKDYSMDDMLGGTRKEAVQEENGYGFSQTAMEGMILADSALSQAKVQGSVAARMEGKAKILKTEIKLDGERGNTEAKQKELAAMEKAATTATAAQMNILASANKSMKDAAEKGGQEDGSTGSKEAEEENPGVEAAKEADSSIVMPYYTPVDVRL